MNLTLGVENEPDEMILTSLADSMKRVSIIIFQYIILIQLQSIRS